jgi:hypothetical protein
MGEGEVPEEPYLPAPEQPRTFDPVLGSVASLKWMDTRAAAARLGLTVGTLQTYRWMGLGPPFRRVGRRIVYAELELEEWSRAAA